MKLVIKVLAVVHFLLAAANAVLVEEAFKKDWLVNSYGQLAHAVAALPGSLLAVTDNSRLVKIDADSKEIQYSVDLSAVPHEHFTILGPLLVASSKDSPRISLYETSTGIFIRDYILNSPPAEIKSVGTDSVAVLDNSGKLYFFGVDAVLALGEHGGRSISTISTPATHYISVGSTAIAVNAANPKSYRVTDYLDISQVYSNGETSASGGLPLLLDEHFGIQVGKLGFQVQEYTGKKTQHTEKLLPGLLSVELFGSKLVVIQLGKVTVFDFSKFLATKKTDAIQSDSFSIEGEFVLVLVDGALVSVLSTPDSKSYLLKLFDSNTKKVTSYEISRQLLSASGPSILVDKPIALSLIEKVHHLVEEQNASILYRWLVRCKTHLVLLGDFATLIVSKKSNTTVDPTEDEYGFEKVLIYVDSRNSKLIAKDTKDGSTLWVASLESPHVTELGSLNSEVYVASSHALTFYSLRTGDFLGSETFAEPITHVSRLVCEIDEEEEEEGVVASVLAVKTTSSFRVLSKGKQLADSQFLLLQEGNTLHGYKLVDEQLRPTWAFSNNGEQILAYTKNEIQLTSSVGIATSGRSVLYKYINPNSVSVLSFNHKNELHLTVLDGVTGSIVYTQEHVGVSVVPESVHLVQSDNWVVYSYLQTSPVVQQTITVVDLFTGKTVPLAETRSAFDPVEVNALSKSFVFPERILSLAPTATKLGITVSSIIALTETGSLIEIPKFMLNSRRPYPSDKVTQKDFADEFRLLKYEAVIPRNNYQVLNHKRKLQLTGNTPSILVRPTELESTAVICLANELNEFCTSVQPSLSYDLLPASFDKVKLSITIAALIAVYVMMQPFVLSKKLNSKWLD